MSLPEIIPIGEFLKRLRMQKMWNEVVKEDPITLVLVPDRFKTQELCNEVVGREPYALSYVPDHFIAQEMCNEAMRNNLALLFLVPDRLKKKKCVKRPLKRIHGC